MADKRERGFYWIRLNMWVGVSEWCPNHPNGPQWYVDGAVYGDDKVEVLSERLVLQKPEQAEQDKFVEGLRSKLIISLLCKTLGDGCFVDTGKEVALSFDQLDRQLLQYDLKMRIDMDGKALVLGLTPKG